MKRVALAFALFGALAALLSGCALDDLLNSMVNKEPRAVIDAQPTQGPAPLTVRLDAHYSHDDDGALLETRWDLGDPAATGSRLESALSHQYQVPGTYLVKLTVTDNEGAMNSQQLAIVVTNPPPVANAAASDLTPHPGDEVQFDASGSSDPYGKIVGYHWAFGDGETADGAKPKHVYKAGGTYPVTLTVTDDGGLTATATLEVRVQPGSSNCGGDTCGGNDTKPLAVITIPYGYTSCSGGTVRVPLTFDGTASRAVTGKIEIYHWDFGDGATASGSSVTHAYEQPWRYTVTLTVTDSSGAVGVAQGVCSIGAASCTGSTGSCTGL